MIDQERFKALLYEAVGEGTQKDFAEKAGISKYTLSRYLSNGLSSAPRRSILYAIANASDGRVDVVDLLHAAGDHEEAERVKASRKEDAPAMPESAAVDPAPESDIPEEYREKAKNFIRNVGEYIASSVKDKSVTEWLDMFSVLYADKGCVIKGTGKDGPYVSPDRYGFHSGGERIFSAVSEWTDLDQGRIYTLPFVLFYCKTEGTEAVPGGVIVRDAAFDLLTLNGLEIPDSGYMLWKVAKVDGAKMSDYPMCLASRPVRS